MCFFREKRGGLPRNKERFSMEIVLNVHYIVYANYGRYSDLYHYDGTRMSKDCSIDERSYLTADEAEQVMKGLRQERRSAGSFWTTETVKFVDLDRFDSDVKAGMTEAEMLDLLNDLAGYDDVIVEKENFRPYGDDSDVADLDQAVAKWGYGEELAAWAFENASEIDAVGHLTAFFRKEIAENADKIRVDPEEIDALAERACQKLPHFRNWSDVLLSDPADWYSIIDYQDL